RFPGRHPQDEHEVLPTEILKISGHESDNRFYECAEAAKADYLDHGQHQGLRQGSQNHENCHSQKLHRSDHSSALTGRAVRLRTCRKISILRGGRIQLDVHHACSENAGGIPDDLARRPMSVMVSIPEELYNKAVEIAEAQHAT